MSLQPALNLPLRFQKAKEQETKTCCIVARSASDFQTRRKQETKTTSMVATCNFFLMFLTASTCSGADVPLGCYLQLTDSLWSANSFCFFIITEFHERRHDVQTVL